MIALIEEMSKPNNMPPMVAIHARKYTLSVWESLHVSRRTVSRSKQTRKRTYRSWEAWGAPWCRFVVLFTFNDVGEELQRRSPMGRSDRSYICCKRASRTLHPLERCVGAIPKLQILRGGINWPTKSQAWSKLFSRASEIITVGALV
jgi:hypothetical protein